MIRKTVQLLLFFLIFFFVLACKTKSVNGNFLNEFKPNADSIFKAEGFKDSLINYFVNTNNHLNLKPYQLENVDKVGGFRRAKLGMSLDSLYYKDWIQSDSLSEKSPYFKSLIYITGNDNRKKIFLNGSLIESIKLTFHNKNLCTILLYFGKNNPTTEQQVFDALYSLYGNNNKNGFGYIKNIVFNLKDTVKSKIWQSSKYRIALNSISGYKDDRPLNSHEKPGLVEFYSLELIFEILNIEGIIKNDWEVFKQERKKERLIKIENNVNNYMNQL